MSHFATDRRRLFQVRVSDSGRDLLSGVSVFHNHSSTDAALANAGAPFFFFPPDLFATVLRGPSAQARPRPS